jgi:hypothetical protein
MFYPETLKTLDLKSETGKGRNKNNCKVVVKSDKFGKK